ncbi:MULTISPECIES: DMT family transporter [Pacificibacter]|uniref:DMT family transporter n=1 Tax=Pacificibacter TaxID=1042323 RepID=UPI001C08F9F2|nr:MULTISPECIES: DMT family transporter [Pacificibacter]MBU2937475.1 DMT family transporter [Pacificibacter marinus]MDO6615655.1 DMT family transporter [Pacificibacter sp. 1_MG-2023]
MTQSAQSRPLAGILWMSITTISFVTMNVLVKYVGTGLPVVQTAFLRFVLGLVFLIPMLKMVRSVVYTREIVGLMVGRGVIHTIAVLLWFYAMTRIPIAEVTAMNFMNPIYVTIGAVFFFREKIAAPRIIALIVAVIGGLVVLRPGFRELDPGHIAMMFTPIAGAGSYLFANALSRRVPATVVVFMLSTIVPLLLLPLVIPVWQTPTMLELLLLFCTSFFATLAHYCMTRAFACAPQSVIQPVSFLQLLWATVFGAALFGEGFDSFVIFGGLMIMASVTFITIREARTKSRTESAKALH